MYLKYFEGLLIVRACMQSTLEGLAWDWLLMKGAPCFKAAFAQ
jgi:hypothetical protein